MDRIEALIDFPIAFGDRENLHIVVNGERLDLLLSVESGQDVRGLMPSWLILAGSGPDACGLRDCIAERSRLDRGEQLLPVLVARDDAHSFGPAVVADVRPVGHQVHWRRFGLDAAESPAALGENVRWLDNAGPFHFDRRQYLDCLETFTRHRPSAARPDLKPYRPFWRCFYALWGAFCGIGSGVLNLPALAYRQTQNELTESSVPSEWSFVRLLPVKGLLALGLDRDEQRLLAINQQAHVFNLTSGRREARADARPISGHDENAATEGIGPLAGRLIPLWGRIGRQTPPDLLREARLVSNGLSGLLAALSADEGRLLIVAQEDGIYIFRRLSAYDAASLRA